MSHPGWRFLRLGVPAALIIVSGFAAPASSAEGEKIGYLNLAKVFDEYQRTKDSETGLEQRGKQRQAQLEAQFNELKKLREGLELLNDQSRESKARELEEKSDEFKRQKTRAERELVTQRNQIAKQILDEIQQVVTDYAKTNGYAMVADQRSLLYGREGLDLTDEVLQLLNSRYGAKAKKAKP